MTNYKLWDCNYEEFIAGYFDGYNIPEKMTKAEAEEWAETLAFEEAYIDLTSIYDKYMADKLDGELEEENEELEVIGKELMYNGCFWWEDLIPLCEITNRNIDDYKYRFKVVCEN